jgi:hypothetical protein
MEELKMILALHAKRYPMMQPTDAVKLIYQNEFGGGHLIRDEEKCLEYLRKEYASVEKKPGMPLYEEIGNGIVRVYLPALPEGNLEQLGRDFIRSAAAHTGSMERFREKLNILRQVASDGFFVFDAAQLESYLSDYEASSYPMVSHSEIYRKLYAPAYRVVLKRLLSF